MDVSRRAVLRGGVAAGATALGVGASGSVAAQEDLASWFSNTSNFDGVVDETGADEVTVTVGVSANQGQFGFGPAAVRVDPGTTVVWEWSGEGGSHNVKAADGGFASELVGSSGHTFSHTFEETGVYRYVCTPHKAMGMKGAVVVGDVDVSTASSGDGESGSGTASTATAQESAGGESSDATASPAATPSGGSGGDDGATLMGASLIAAAVSPAIFGIVLKAVGTRGED